MSLTTTNRQKIKEVPWGMYVWICPNGEPVVDAEDRVMHVVCEEGNQASINALTKAAAYYGFPEGRPVYWSGKRPVTDEEYEHQVERMKAGLVPDPFDISAIREEEAALRAHNR